METFIAIAIVAMLAMLFAGAALAGLGYLFMGAYAILVSIMRAIERILR